MNKVNEIFNTLIKTKHFTLVKGKRNIIKTISGNKEIIYTININTLNNLYDLFSKNEIVLKSIEINSNKYQIIIYYTSIPDT